MEGISNFLESDAFLPIIIIILLILIALFVVIIINNKNKEKIRKATLQVYQNNTSEIQNQIYEENPVSEIKIVQDDAPKVELTEEQKEELPLVDIPIPDVTDTPIDIDAVPEVIQDEVAQNDTQIVVEEEAPVVEAKPEEDEIVNIETNIEVPEETNTSVAFNSEASAVSDIKDEAAIEIEEPHEYTGEKTEIFDFPDFTGLNGNDSQKIAVSELEKGKEIEEDILKAADSFINSIMSK